MFCFCFWLKMKGVGEVVEGLIPYSQRHYSRIDRLERSTYLLDYTLNGMSLIEPETGVVENPKPKLQDSSIGFSDEQQASKKSSKKRKSQKSNGGNKKVKGM